MSAKVVSKVLPPPENLIEIKDFFKGKSVFITGATGFMGKVLIEKLLWECSDIGNVYILLREKRGKSVEQRLQGILDLEIFDRIKKINLNLLKRIIPIQGDVCELNLGISNDDIRTLEANVAVVFHFAATVRFTEPLKTAILLNVRGTREIVNLTRNMKNIKALVHVSTMYANTDKPTIEETVYNTDADWRTIIKIAEVVDENSLNSLQDKIKGYQPNTYTYTKYLAENVINEYKNEIPTAIFRPSIVAGCMKDPIPGWVDCLHGANGIWIAIITGVLHIAHAKGSGINDYIPCDYCANALIITACYRGNYKAKECLTINAASGDTKEINPSNLFDMAYAGLERVPFEKMLWEPAFYTTQNRYLYMFLVFVLHLIPGIFFELLLKIAGVKFSLLAVYRKIFIVNDVLKFFMMNQWTIITNNYYALIDYMHPNDKKKFECNLTTLNNVEATNIGLTGIKRFILKEEFTEEAMKRARRHVRRVRIANFILKGIVTTLGFWLTYKILNFSTLKIVDTLF